MQKRVQESSWNQAILEPPKHFFFVPAEWPAWKTRFERYRIASGLSEDRENKPIATLINSLGDKADDIYNSCNVKENESTYLEVLNQ